MRKAAHEREAAKEWAPAPGTKQGMSCGFSPLLEAEAVEAALYVSRRRFSPDTIGRGPSSSGRIRPVIHGRAGDLDGSGGAGFPM